MYSSTLSLTSALDARGWLTPRPGRFTPGKETWCPLYRRLSGPQIRSGRVRKITSQPGLSFCIFFYSVLHPYLFLCLGSPAFCLLFYNTQHLFCLCTLFVLVFPDCPGFCLLSLRYKTQEVFCKMCWCKRTKYESKVTYYYSHLYR
jgi:hypothetical protein